MKGATQEERKNKKKTLEKHSDWRHRAQTDRGKEGGEQNDDEQEEERRCGLSDMWKSKRNRMRQAESTRKRRRINNLVVFPTYPSRFIRSLLLCCLTTCSNTYMASLTSCKEEGSTALIWATYHSVGKSGRCALTAARRICTVDHIDLPNAVTSH